jgi:hypothetical protein
VNHLDKMARAIFANPIAARFTLLGFSRDILEN